jgi:predicted outer membrane repeat protein
MKVTGAPFGSSSQFIEWYGPYFASLSSCTEANAVYYLKTNGSAYFGGTLSAGTLTNKGETSDLSASAQITVGPFGTNGDPKVVTLSYYFTGNWTQFQGSSTGTGGGAISATVKLYRKIGAGSETEVATLNVSGTYEYETDGEPYPNGTYARFWSQSMSGSASYTDNDASLSDRTYRAAITARSTAFGTGTNSQRVTIVSVEE